MSDAVSASLVIGSISEVVFRRKEGLDFGEKRLTKKELNIDFFEGGFSVELLTFEKQCPNKLLDFFDCGPIFNTLSKN